MIRTFIDFTLHSARNRIVQRLRRLRDPRYLVGAIAGIGYFWMVFFRNTARPKVTVASVDVVVDVLAAVVLIIMIVAWALPSDSGGLQFSEAEITFLFPAPVRRRDLLLYKIIRAQPRALGSAVAFFIFGWRRSFLVGMWAALSVLGIYFTFVALGRARLKLMHVGFMARLLIVGAILGALSVFATSRIHGVHMERYDAKLLAQLFSGVFHTGAAKAVLFVPRLFATAASAPTPAQLGTSIAGVLALGVVLFFLAARMNVSFEEASIVASAKRAAYVERMRARQGGRMAVSYRRLGPMFRLGETGPPEVAIVWKNVIALVRTAFGFVVLFLLLAVLLLGLGLYFHDNEAPDRVIGPLLLMVACFLPLTGPQLFANDLRLDLARAEILKSYPLIGERLVAGEMAAPLCVIAALEVIFAASGSLLIHMDNQTSRFMQFVGTPEFIVTVLVLTLPVCAMLLVLRNAFPLYFPAWSMRPTDDTRGFVNVGQRFIILAANLLALFLALLPAALVGAPTAWIAYKFFSGSAIAVPVATVPAAMIICFEVWFGVRMLGKRFDEMDVSNEMELLTV